MVKKSTVLIACSLFSFNLLIAWLNIHEFFLQQVGGETGRLKEKASTAANSSLNTTVMMMMMTEQRKEEEDSSSCGSTSSTTAAAATTMILHDVTMEWRTDVNRQWLLPLSNHNNISSNCTGTTTAGRSADDAYRTATTNSRTNRRPPAMLLLTNYGWNHPNQTTGLNLYRGVRPKELVQGVINHPWFHPMDWTNAIQHYYTTVKNDNNNNSTTPPPRYYVFLDYETCLERNYPWYGWGLEKNADTEYNRTNSSATTHKNPTLPSLTALHQQVMDMIVVKESNATADQHLQHHSPPPSVTFISFHCGGNGINTRKLDQNIVHVAISAQFAQLRPGIDLGLVPPAVYQKEVLQVPVDVSDAKEESLLSSSWWCDESNRTFFLQFCGNFRATTRQKLRLLHNGQDIYIANQLPPNETMGSALIKTVFALAPRGDNLFSYRFTEIMSTGAIPVVHADGWMLPFDTPLVDWNDIVVRIPEDRANETVDILKLIPADRRCEMRRKGFAFWQKYMQDGDAVIRGIVDTLEGRANKTLTASTPTKTTTTTTTTAG
jgi:Exostosin family